MWRNRWYMLQEEQNEPGEKGSGGGGEKPPVDPPKGGERKGGGGAPDIPKTIPLDVLPEDLRDRPVEEQRFLLNHMVSALGERNNQVEQLREQIAELRGAVSNRPEPKVEPDPDDGKPLEELILEDADKALERWAQKRGFVSAFDSLESRVGEAEFTMVANQIDDFAEHEDDVRKLLKVGKIPATKANIVGAYKMVVGEKVLAERARGNRRGSGSVPPSNPEPPKPEQTEPKWNSELEKEVARAHGVVDPAEWHQHSGDAPMKIKLPK